MNKQRKKSMEGKIFQKNIQNKKNDREIVHNNESPKSVLQKKGRRRLEEKQEKQRGEIISLFGSFGG